MWHGSELDGRRLVAGDLEQDEEQGRIARLCEAWDYVQPPGASCSEDADGGNLPDLDQPLTSSIGLILLT